VSASSAFVTTVHVPVEQLLHAPVQASLQQTESRQSPFMHSFPTTHATPFAFLTKQPAAPAQ
jgi:hypothetical protein